MSYSSYASNLIVIAQGFSSYFVYINFALGLIGNVINIFVLTDRKVFHRNQCAFYLIVESFVDIGQLTQNLANELWKLSINKVDPTTVSLVWCKLRTILPQWFRLMLSAIVCFAAIDQFLSTNPVPHLRQLSSFRMAQYQICFASSLFLLHTLPVALFLQIHPPLGCIVSNSGLITYYSYVFYPLVNGLLPIFISSLFSILAYRNVRRIIRRQVPLERRELDQQLTAMIFIRVIFYVWLQLPFTIYRIYSLNSVIIPGQSIAYAIDRWMSAISMTLVYLSHAVNFYVFLGISSRYRRQVKCFLVEKCWQPLRQCCCGHQNTIHPFNRTSIESIGGPRH